MGITFPNLPGIPDFARYDPNASILWEQSLNNRFVIYLPPNFSGAKELGDLSGILVLACRTATQPGFTVNVTTDNWFQYQFRIHSASTPTGGTVNIGFRGFMNPRDPAWILLQWIRSAVEVIPQTGIESYYTGARKEYMTDAYLFLLTHKMVPFRIVKYAGIFPTGIPAVSYTYGTGALITYTATFAYQWSEFVDLS